MEAISLGTRFAIGRDPRGDLVELPVAEMTAALAPLRAAIEATGEPPAGTTRRELAEGMATMQRCSAELSRHVELGQLV